jgi:hypothetical protein
MTPTERAFAVGACIAGGSTHPEAAAYFPHATTSAIQKLCKRVTERSKAENLLITDASFYEDAPGRGRPELLTPRQKRAIVKIVTSDRAHREKEPRQAIADGDFSDIIPVMSITTFENVMYEAGYARRKPDWKPPLTPEEEAERYQWAKEHNPDRYALNHGLSFNFRTVAFTDETPAQFGEQRGMQRTWMKEEEHYNKDVKKDRILKYSQLQFYSAFAYNSKGPCVIYKRETKQEKAANNAALEKENVQRRADANAAHKQKKEALNALTPSQVNAISIGQQEERSQLLKSRKHAFTKQDEYTRGKRLRGGINRYRHQEVALKKLIP